MLPLNDITLAVVGSCISVVVVAQDIVVQVTLLQFIEPVFEL